MRKSYRESGTAVMEQALVSMFRDLTRDNDCLQGKYSRDQWLKKRGSKKIAEGNSTYPNSNNCYLRTFNC